MAKCELLAGPGLDAARRRQHDLGLGLRRMASIGAGAAAGRLSAEPLPGSRDLCVRRLGPAA